MSESILSVSDYFPPHFGGIENVASEQAKHLTLLGHDVTVLSTAIGELAGTHRQPGGYTVPFRPDVESASTALEHVGADAEVHAGMARYSHELAGNRCPSMTRARALDTVYRDVYRDLLPVPTGG